MEIKIRRTIAILLAVCFLVSLTAAAVSATAENENPGVVPPNTKYLGNTYGD